MKKKISAFEIALSAIACAISTIFLSLGVLNDFLLATGYIVGCFAMMLPLAKGFIVGDALAYVATVLLTFLFGGISVPAAAFLCRPMLAFTPRMRCSASFMRSSVMTPLL